MEPWPIRGSQEGEMGQVGGKKSGWLEEPNSFAFGHTPNSGKCRCQVCVSSCLSLSNRSNLTNLKDHVV
jgi:hypothetical protein